MKSVVNLTIPSVIKKIDRLLANHSDHHCQQIFANPDLRQELIAYVLNRIQSVYRAIDEEEIASYVEMFDYIGDQLDSELLYQGIHQILQHHEVLQDLQVPEENDDYLAACHWFG